MQHFQTRKKHNAKVLLYKNKQKKLIQTLTTVENCLKIENKNEELIDRIKIFKDEKNYNE